MQDAQELLTKLIQEADTQRDTEIPGSPVPEPVEDSAGPPAKRPKLSRRRTRSLRIASASRARKQEAQASPPEVPKDTEAPPELPTPAEPSKPKDSSQTGPIDTAEGQSKLGTTDNPDAPSKTVASAAPERHYDAEKEDAQNPWLFEGRTLSLRSSPSPLRKPVPRKDLLPEFSAAASGIWPLRDAQNPAVLALPAPPSPNKKNDDVESGKNDACQDDVYAIPDSEEDGVDLTPGDIKTALAQILEEECDPCLYLGRVTCTTLPKPPASHDGSKDEPDESHPYDVPEKKACRYFTCMICQQH